MCSFGYDNITTDFTLSYTLIGGVTGSVLGYYFIERAGPLEEISKSLYILSKYNFLGFILVSRLLFGIIRLKSRFVIGYY